MSREIERKRPTEDIEKESEKERETQINTERRLREGYGERGH
jgi:hypothetical protein